MKQKQRKNQSLFADLLQMKVNVQREIGKLALQRSRAYNISPFPLFTGHWCHELYNTVPPLTVLSPCFTSKGKHILNCIISIWFQFPLSVPLKAVSLKDLICIPRRSHVRGLYLFILMLHLKCERSNLTFCVGVRSIMIIMWDNVHLLPMVRSEVRVS